MLQRAPVGDNQDDYDVLEDGVIVGRIFVHDASRAAGPPSDVGERPRRADQARGARLRGHARGGDGAVREVLAPPIALSL
jgi:hypothetical protein